MSSPSDDGAAYSRKVLEVIKDTEQPANSSTQLSIRDATVPDEKEPAKGAPMKSVNLADDSPFDPHCDPANPITLTFEDIMNAKQRIVGGIIRTQLYVNYFFSPISSSIQSKFRHYSIVRRT